jgi:hypothetical protein
MNLEELINQIQAVQMAEGEIVSTDEIRQILLNAAVADAIAQRISFETPKRISVARVYMRGRKSSLGSDRNTPFIYDRKLNSGINLWIGDNDSGKSTILKCILWALSGVEPAIKSDIRPWLEEIAVEFEMSGDEVYTVRFSTRVDQRSPVGEIYAARLQELQSTGSGRLLETFSDNRSMKTAVDRLFSRLLGFPSLSWIKPAQDFSGSIKEQTISWDVYSQALFTIKKHLAFILA